MRMILQLRVLIFVGLLTLVLSGAHEPAQAAAPALKLEKGDHVCYIGNRLLENKTNRNFSYSLPPGVYIGVLLPGEDRFFSR